MVYATAVSDGVHNLMTMESSPAPRAHAAVVTSCSGVPALLAAARANIQRRRGCSSSAASVMLRGVADLLRDDLPLAFAERQGSGAAGGAARGGGTAARRRDRAVRDRARDDDADSARPATTRSAPPNVEARYRAEELIDTPAADAAGDRRARAGEDAGRVHGRRGARRSGRGRRSTCGATC